MDRHEKQTEQRNRSGKSTQQSWRLLPSDTNNAHPMMGSTFLQLPFKALLLSGHRCKKCDFGRRRRRHWRSSTIQGAWEFLRLRMHKKLNNSFAALESQRSAWEREPLDLWRSFFSRVAVYIYIPIENSKRWGQWAVLHYWVDCSAVDQWSKTITGPIQEAIKESLGVIKITRSWGRKSIGFDRMESSSHTWRSHHQKFINGELLDRL